MCLETTHPFLPYNLLFTPNCLQIHVSPISNFAFWTSSDFFFSACNVVFVVLYPNNFFNCLVAFHPLGFDLGALTPRNPSLTPSATLRFEYIPFPLCLLLKFYACVYHMLHLLISHFPQLHDAHPKGSNYVLLIFKSPVPSIGTVKMVTLLNT